MAFFPATNDSGNVTFSSALIGPSVTGANNVVLWYGSGDTFSAIAREGDQAPGVPMGIVFNRVDSVSDFHTRLGGPGITAFSSLLSGSYPLATCLHSVGTTSLVTLDGAQAAGLAPGVTYNSIGSVAINPNGALALTAIIQGPGITFYQNDRLAYEFTSGSWAIEARSNDPAPGADPYPNVLFDAFGGPGVMGMDAIGRMGIYCLLKGSGVTTSNRFGFWFGPPGALTLVARTGSQAGGLPGGVVYGLFGLHMALNNSGQVAFGAPLSGAGVDTTNNEAIFAGPYQSAGAVLRKGDATPGVAGARFRTFDASRLGLNGLNQLAFSAYIQGDSVSGTDNQGLWVGAPGALQLVARLGKPAAGLSSDVTYASLTTYGLASSGFGAFLATLAGSGVNATNNYALFGFSLNGAIDVIVRTGDTLEVAPGDNRIVRDVRLTLNSFGGQDGLPSGLASDGSLVYRLAFTDGSTGIFRSKVQDLGVRGRDDQSRLFRIDRLEPNPARHGVTVHFSVAKPTQLTWSVLDIMGRVVFDASESRAAGVGTWTWSGNSANGMPASPGVYMLRMQGPRLDAVKRFVLVR